MADFDIAYRIMLRHEGGYANVAGDRGGETYRGISRRWNPAWPGWATIDGVKATRSIKWNEIIKDERLEALVRSFYRGRWQGVSGDGIRSQAVADIFFDFSILSGAAVRLMQATLNNKLGQAPRLLLDNRMGPLTLKAVNAADPVRLLGAYKQARREHHEADVARNPEQVKFMANWLARIASFPDLAAEKKKGSA